jgi:hypothetical protein
MNMRRTAIASATAAAIAVVGAAGLAGVAAADGPGTTRPLIEPGTTPSTNDQQTHGTVIIRPRPTPQPFPPEPAPVTSIVPNYTG